METEKSGPGFGWHKPKPKEKTDTGSTAKALAENSSILAGLQDVNNLLAQKSGVSQEEDYSMQEWINRLRKEGGG